MRGETKPTADLNTDLDKYMSRFEKLLNVPIRDISTVSYLNGPLPVLGLRHNAELRHCAPCTSAGLVAHVNLNEGWLCHGSIALANAEVQHTQHDLGHDADFDICHGLDALHRELAEEGEGEVLQQMVAEDADWGRLLFRP